MPSGHRRVTILNDLRPSLPRMPATRPASSTGKKRALLTQERPYFSILRRESLWRTETPDFLENDSQCQLSHSRVAVEHLVPLAEARVARDQIVANSGVIRGVVDRADLSRSVLRMVESVGEVPTELQCLALADDELFPERQV